MELCSLANKGLYYACQCCGNCCNSLIDGVIIMYENDVNALASFFGQSSKIIAHKYLKIQSVEYDFTTNPLANHKKPLFLDTLTLNFDRNADCIFLEKKNGHYNCKVYSARPSQCKNYPLLSFILSSNEQLQPVLTDCPGISLNSEHAQNFNKNNTKIRKYSSTELSNLIQEEQEIEYNYYLHLKKHNFKIKKIYQFL